MTHHFGLEGSEGRGVSLAAIPTPFLDDCRPGIGFRSFLIGICNSVWPSILLTEFSVDGGESDEGISSAEGRPSPLVSTGESASWLKSTDLATDE